MDWDQLKEHSFPLPPIVEQHRIVAAIEEQFTRIDAGVAALKRAQARLKRYRASVLKAAVEGKLTEAWRAANPPSETAPELLNRILAERRARWEADLKAKGKDPTKMRYEEPRGPDTSGLPELPEGWGWSALGECFTVCVGATPSRGEPTYWGGGIPWVSSGEVQFCRITETREHISERGLEHSSTRVNPAGSVLLGMIGEGRTRGQVAILDIAACNNQNCAAIWVSETPVRPLLVYYWLWSQYDLTRQKGSGNNQPALNKARVEQMPFPLPPVGEQNQIVAEIEARLSIVHAQEATVEANMKRAERLRQSILAAAFAGRLVPQDPSDEPASVLLERIRAEREETPPSPSPTRGGRIGTSGHSGQLARGNGQPRSRPGRKISGSIGGGLVGATNRRDQAGSARRRAPDGEVIPVTSETPRERLPESGELDADGVNSIEGTQLPLVWGAAPVASVDRRPNAQAVPSRAEAPSDV